MLEWIAGMSCPVNLSNYLENMHLWEEHGYVTLSINKLDDDSYYFVFMSTFMRGISLKTELNTPALKE